MKTLFAILLIATSIPAAPSLASERDIEVKGKKLKKICTPVRHKGGSRLSSARVCLTEDQWRAKLGSDWKSLLAGANVTEDLDKLDVMAPNQEGYRPLKPVKGP